LPAGSAPPEPLYVLPGREVWTGVKVAGAGIVETVDTVDVNVVVVVKVDLQRRKWWLVSIFQTQMQH
jgi:hypothetical protein